jgi:hypothetical protein
MTLPIATVSIRKPVNITVTENDFEDKRYWILGRKAKMNSSFEN